MLDKSEFSIHFELVQVVDDRDPHVINDRLRRVAWSKLTSVFETLTIIALKDIAAASAVAAVNETDSIFDKASAADVSAFFATVDALERSDRNELSWSCALLLKLFK